MHAPGLTVFLLIPYMCIHYAIYLCSVSYYVVVCTSHRDLHHPVLGVIVCCCCYSLITRAFPPTFCWIIPFVRVTFCYALVDFATHANFTVLPILPLPTFPTYHGFDVSSPFVVLVICIYISPTSVCVIGIPVVLYTYSHYYYPFYTQFHTQHLWVPSSFLLINILLYTYLLCCSPPTPFSHCTPPVLCLRLLP